MTHRIWTFLAQVNFAEPKAGALRFSTDLLLLVGALVLVILVFLVWAVFLRKGKEADFSDWKVQQQHHHQHDHSDSSSGGEGSHHYRRRRRRRREHRPRNPTLAETGGLPPARSQPSSSEPAA